MTNPMTLERALPLVLEWAGIKPYWALGLQGKPEIVMDDAMLAQVLRRLSQDRHCYDVTFGVETDGMYCTLDRSPDALPEIDAVAPTHVEALVLVIGTWLEGQK